ncbi:protein FATTY ACID EXPORT 4, chloroplastic [Ricinus communis]|uniref:protein FATTY ACID EXPORT 4, chloroplastic n=1 Tax=Ricinus communis TaxID=3988 RepID=UPI000D6934F4|nr:protein FATTY ACID EXPORT 4, chloroplastic [Ricinus communis]|eukprot:XP_025013057.1 protein FATTY ACID EXPORT 4, chloroplastic [Ricinus communis]
MATACCLLVIPFPGAKLTAVNEYELVRRRKDVSLYGGRYPFPRERNGNRSNIKTQSPSGSCKCQLIDLAPATSATYGALLLAGGLFAFNKSRSKGSLFGGLTGATLMAASVFLCVGGNGFQMQAYFLMQREETKAVGDALGFGSAFLFSSVFGIRLVGSRKLIPAGPLLGLSICALAVFMSSYFQDSL